MFLLGMRFGDLTVELIKMKETRVVAARYFIVYCDLLYPRVSSSINVILATLHWEADPTLPRAALTSILGARNKAGVTSEKTTWRCHYWIVLRSSHEVMDYSSSSVSEGCV